MRLTSKFGGIRPDSSACQPLAARKFAGGFSVYMTAFSMSAAIGHKLSTAVLMWFARHRTKPLRRVLVIRSVKSIAVTSSPRNLRTSVFKNQFLLDG